MKENWLIPIFWIYLNTKILSTYVYNQAEDSKGTAWKEEVDHYLSVFSCRNCAIESGLNQD